MKKLLIFLCLTVSTSAFAIGMANFPILSSSNVNTLGNTTSSVIPLGQDLGYAIQAVWTGTPSGTLTVQASNDHSNPTNWTVLTGTSVTVTGGAGNALYSIAEPFYTYAELVYTSGATTGSTTTGGAINATATVKTP